MTPNVALFLEWLEKTKFISRCTELFVFCRKRSKLLQTSLSIMMPMNMYSQPSIDFLLLPFVIPKFTNLDGQ